jgi:hypothetical protein
MRSNRAHVSHEIVWGGLLLVQHLAGPRLTGSCTGHSLQLAKLPQERKSAVRYLIEWPCYRSCLVQVFCCLLTPQGRSWAVRLLAHVQSNSNLQLLSETRRQAGCSHCVADAQ